MRFVTLSYLCWLVVCATAWFAWGETAKADQPPSFNQPDAWFQAPGLRPVWTDPPPSLQPLSNTPVLVSPPQPVAGVIQRVAFVQEEVSEEPRTVDPLPIEGEVITPGGCNCGACQHCRSLTGRTRASRFAQALYFAVTTPPSCYDPAWSHLGNAAVHADPIRPQTQQRIRWDAGWKLLFPDRAEYFWAQSGGGGLGPAVAERSIDYHELTLYTEAAHNGFGAFVEVPYRSIYPENQGHLAGFGDIIVGTKSVLHDSEFLLIATQFRTHLPTGVASKGLGVEHVSLEPSLLVGVHLTPKTYLQAQVSEWIPLGGDPNFAGALLRFGGSINRTVWCKCEDTQLIASAEIQGWSFQDGSFTDPALGTLSASNTTYLHAGPSLRFVFSKNVDFGFGALFAVSEPHWAEQLYRTELRIRY